MKSNTNSEKLLITGGGGFIGRSLCGFMNERGYSVIASVRGGKPDLPVKHIPLEIAPSTDWSTPLIGVDYVIHLASITEGDKSTDDQRRQLWATNVEGTSNLAEQAAAAGIKKFIYLSTAKVNGGQSKNRPFREEDEPDPPDCYGKSKLAAEKALRAISDKTGLKTVIIRPPLVYGPGVKGNFLRMLNWIDKGFPLPFGSLKNSRSLINIDNLIDFIELCLKHPNAENNTFMISDGEDLSTPEMIKRLAFYMGKSPHLLPIPCNLIKFAGTLLGKKSELDRLCGSLQIDPARARAKLSWSPVLSVNEGLRKTVSWYMNNA